MGPSTQVIVGLVLAAGMFGIGAPDRQSQFGLQIPSAA
jgi:hypothetical protein